MIHVAYYNENDHAAAVWLRELIREGLIPYGHVDERDRHQLAAVLGHRPHG